MKPRALLLPALALAGLLLAVTTALRGQAPRQEARPAALPPRAPFEAYIGGAGLVEAASRNIAVGAHVPGVVSRVAVRVGDKVEAGRTLFEIDPREARAELAVKRADLEKARAALGEAKASLDDYRAQFSMVSGVRDRRAVSSDEVEKRRNALALAKARLESAQAAVAAADAAVAAAATALERLTVRAPITGEVLQVNVRPGEFAATGSLSTPLMLLGDLSRLHVRVDLDENDAWRFAAGARGVAALRGNRDRRAELRFEYLEPCLTAKTSLTGSSTERVDTRVLQAVYSVDPAQLPCYVGQQVDVFIEDRAAAQAGGDGS
ncbi:Macrolide export protein MacA [Fundidesulfovibrio magnetotacticus]|uniref:Macrolide export protein MacA n=1 Tax=Fundidesulfovibrio magnetotacticus TaxID=2730080 RepID=A0A6V8LYE0_9BACT|nr:HlyD family efflux transporter periplasmic adaptor subunit [Fundidesulfovibrio magnetotacticus]GFK95049.1 Macrolide export protein MacA [Fundidesulfovibrio magnetotacticus]